MFLHSIKHYVMKICGGRAGIAPKILNLNNRWRCVANVTTRRSTPLEELPVPLREKVDGPHISGNPSLCNHPVSSHYCEWDIFSSTRKSQAMINHQDSFPCCSTFMTNLLDHSPLTAYKYKEKKTRTDVANRTNSSVKFIKVVSPGFGPLQILWTPCFRHFHSVICKIWPTFHWQTGLRICSMHIRQATDRFRALAAV